MRPFLVLAFLALTTLTANAQFSIRVEPQAGFTPTYQANAGLRINYIDTVHAQSESFTTVGVYAVAEVFPRITDQTYSGAGIRSITNSNGSIFGIATNTTCTSGGTGLFLITKIETIADASGNGNRITFWIPGATSQNELNADRCNVTSSNTLLSVYFVITNPGLNGWSAQSAIRDVYLKLAFNMVEKYPIEYKVDQTGGTVTSVQHLLASYGMGFTIESGGYHYNVDTGAYTLLKNCAVNGQACNVRNAGTNTYNVLVFYTSSTDGLATGNLYSTVGGLLYAEDVTSLSSHSGQLFVDYQGPTVYPGVSQWNFKMSSANYTDIVAKGGFYGYAMKWSGWTISTNGEHWTGAFALTQGW